MKTTRSYSEDRATSFPVSTMRRRLLSPDSFSHPAAHKFTCSGKQVRPRTACRARGRTIRAGKNCGGSQVVSRRELKKYRSPGDTRSSASWRLRRRALPLFAAPPRAKPLKNSDNTSPGSGAHLNVCIHTLVYRFDERCGQNYSNWPGLFFLLSVWDTF